MKTFTGAFMANNAVAAPMAANPPPAARHGEMKRPDNNWSAPPAGTGAGYPGAVEVVPTMRATGIMQDFGAQWGHAGTAKTRTSRRARFVDKFLARDTDAQKVIEYRAENASAAAHGDKAAAFYPGHVYEPYPAKFSGEAYVVDFGAGEAGDAVAMSGRVIAKTNGGEHMDGPLEAMYKAVGYRRGVDRRFAIARYSSPTLGAMYSKNTLRGVLPQTIAVPYNVPPVKTWSPTTSGIGSNQRFPRVNFTTPAIFRSPPSESDTMIAARSHDIAPVIGLGF